MEKTSWWRAFGSGYLGNVTMLTSFDFSPCWKRHQSDQVQFWFISEPTSSWHISHTSTKRDRRKFNCKLFLPFPKYTKYLMGRYSNNCCTAPVLCTGVCDQSLFNIGGVRLFSTYPWGNYYTVLDPVFLALLALWQCSSSPSPLCSIMCIVTRPCVHTLRYSSAFRCVGSASHAGGGLLKFLLVNPCILAMSHSWQRRSPVLFARCSCSLIDICTHWPCSRAVGFCSGIADASYHSSTWVSWIDWGWL